MHANSPAINVAIVTLDGHLGQTIVRAEKKLQKIIPNLSMTLHPASDWDNDQDALDSCHNAIDNANIIICTMLFMEPHVDAVLPQLKARAPHCDALVGAMSANPIVQMTHLGKLDMSREPTGAMKYLKKLRGSKKSGQSGGASQMKVLRRLPKVLRFIPGTAQDLRIYFMMLQCWLAGSETNLINMVQLLIKRYAAGERESLRELANEVPLKDYPETGLYHPRIPNRITTDLSQLPKSKTHSGTIGLLMMRSYLLADNTAHYDAVIHALEARGLRVIPAFASGLDARPAIDAFFKNEQGTSIDCLVSLTGFSLVGGPAYNDSESAVEAMKLLNVPYIAAHSSEFQSLGKWRNSKRGLTPVETTMMVALPELDGAISPTLYAGHEHEGRKGDADKQPILERVERLADKAVNTVALAQSDRKNRKIGIVVFNYPPNAGAVGTAAYLSVFESLFNTLSRLSSEGYEVELPESVDTLREQLLLGNSQQYGTDANVLHTVDVNTHVSQTPWLEDIEAMWGPAPGKQLTNGAGIFILGLQLGNVTIALQPSFGMEGDPMRLLYDQGAAPTHAFSAFYHYLNHTISVDALLHFGTHGALEFMSGKQSGLSENCWPERLIEATPNFYFYAANNPSEAAIAKRRSSATLISHLTPSITEAGLYKGLSDLKASIQQWHQLDNRTNEEADDLFTLIGQQVEELELISAIDTELPALHDFVNVDHFIAALQKHLNEYEAELIPNGMHIIGAVPPLEERVDLLHAYALCSDEDDLPEKADIQRWIESDRLQQPVSTPILQSDALSDDVDQKLTSWQDRLTHMNRQLEGDHELDSLINALDTGYVPPVPGGDLLRNSETLPTGRNIHGFDPFRLPSAVAQSRGHRYADQLIERHKLDTGAAPTCIAFVLWGSDNLKNEGIPIAQAMALIGARPRFDGYGKLAGAELIPLEELGRPRVDVMITLSGVFRDLLPLQTRMLAESALLAAQADAEPALMNPIRTHTLAYQSQNEIDFETAALRVFGNADGAYGANVNQLIDAGTWTSEDQLAETYSSRKCYAFDAHGKTAKHADVLDSVLADVELTYQNLESVELGVTQLDYYFDTLGGINSMIRRARGAAVPTYIGDQTRNAGTVRTLQEQVSLETRTRVLNPKWYEGQLKHGYEGVRAIETSITNTLGWSATTGQIAPWVYNQVAHTFMLDENMRDRLATLNPSSSARMANRLIEAHERNYWSPSEEVLQALQDAGEELEDRLEGVFAGAQA